MSAVPAIEFKNISKSFSGVAALSDVSFSIKKGEVHALMGENGAGKSTLVKILSGALSKDAGEIYINGVLAEIKTPLDARQQGVSIIYQELSLISQLNAEENLFLGSMPANRLGVIDWEKIRKQTEQIFNEMALDIDTNIPVRQLSAAQCQMVEIGRSLLHKAEIIVMDEPTSSLTDREIQYLFRIIEKLKKQGVTIIFISHKFEEVFEISDSVTVLRDGRVTGQLDIKETCKEDLVRMMIGRDIEDYYPDRKPKFGDVVLEVKGLENGKQVQNINFSVRKGEILGFAGLVGAGRTETMRAIFGADKPKAGEIYIDGTLVQISSPSDAIKHGIAFAPEDRKTQGLLLGLPINQNITIASMNSVAVRFNVINKIKELKLTNDYIAKLNIRARNAFQRVAYLSGGNQQKVVISKWLNTQAKVYIFDEPTKGIDVGSKSSIYRLLSELAASGLSIIVVSSELPEILGICDRVIVMREGRIVAELDRNEASEEKIMSFAMGVF